MSVLNKIDRMDAIRILLEEICHCLHRHEVQSWKDCPGTIEERSKFALSNARMALAVLTERADPLNALAALHERTANRDLAASGGIVDSP